MQTYQANRNTHTHIIYIYIFIKALKTEETAYTNRYHEYTHKITCQAAAACKGKALDESHGPGDLQVTQGAATSKGTGFLNGLGH